MAKALNLSDWELEELVPQALGLSEEDTESLINNHYDLEEWLHDKLMNSHDESLTGLIHVLVSGLMPMIFVGNDLMANTQSKGFGVERSPGVITAICKLKIDSNKGKNG